MVIPRAALSYEEREQRERERVEANRRYQLAECWKKVIVAFGRRYAEARLENFELYHDAQRAAVNTLRDFGANLPVNVADGNSLILFGPAGTGKDHLLAALIRLAIFSHGIEVEWIDGMALYGAMRDNIDASTSEARLLHRFTSPRILAISDPIPPNGTLTDFQASTLFRIIDTRYRNQLPTWVTINVASSAEAEVRMGVQAVDRLRHGATALHCNWPSYRQRGQK